MTLGDCLNHGYYYVDPTCTTYTVNPYSIEADADDDDWPNPKEKLVGLVKVKGDKFVKLCYRQIVVLLFLNLSLFLRMMRNPPLRYPLNTLSEEESLLT